MGERWVSVGPERLERWLRGFEERHGRLAWQLSSPQTLSGTAADGALAECEVPFPPLDVDLTAPYAGLVRHVAADRRVGVLLVRLGGYAAGVFDGDRLVASKVGSRPVHGRAAAGGSSQQRFARRREGQVKVALAAAVDAAERVLVPASGSLDAVVTGGDRRALGTVLADRRLQPLRPLVCARVLDVPDPRRRVLADTPRLFRAVRIRVVDPDPH